MRTCDFAALVNRTRRIGPKTFVPFLESMKIAAAQRPVIRSPTVAHFTLASAL